MRKVAGLNCPDMSLSVSCSCTFISNTETSPASPSGFYSFPTPYPFPFTKSHTCPPPFLFIFHRKPLTPLCNKSHEAKELSEAPEDEWMKRLPDKKKPLYSHSLPCIEAWLRNLGFSQTAEDRAVWLIQKSNWHAQLSLDVTELYIRYLKIGPGNLEKDIERRFSYALSREDIENAVLGGP